MSWLSFGIFCLTIFILRLPALNYICRCTRIFLNYSNSPCGEIQRYVLYSSTICQMQRMTNLVHWLSDCPCVHLKAKHVGISQSCHITLSCIFASCHHGLSRSLARERIAAAGTSLNHADKVNEKAK